MEPFVIFYVLYGSIMLMQQGWNDNQGMFIGMTRYIFGVVGVLLSLYLCKTELIRIIGST